MKTSPKMTAKRAAVRSSSRSSKLTNFFVIHPIYEVKRSLRSRKVFA